MCAPGGCGPEAALDSGRPTLAARSSAKPAAVASREGHVGAASGGPSRTIGYAGPGGSNVERVAALVLAAADRPGRSSSALHAAVSYIERCAVSAHVQLRKRKHTHSY